MKEWRRKNNNREKSRMEEEIKKAQIQRFMGAGYTRKDAEKEWGKVRKEMLNAAREFGNVNREIPVKRQVSRFT